MPIKLCQCKRPATYRGKCDECRKAYERERSRRRRKQGKGGAVYGTKMWQMRRMQVLARDGLCQDGRVCGGKHVAEEVDHLTPLARGGALYDLNNLRGTCRPCHRVKTANENAGEGDGVTP